MKPSTAPANDTAFDPHVYQGLDAARAYATKVARAVLDVEALVERGVIPETDRGVAERVAFAFAGIGQGRVVTAAIEGVRRRKPSIHAGRAALLELLRKPARPTEIDPTRETTAAAIERVELRRALRKIDFRLATLTSEELTAEALLDSDELRRAARISIKVGAFSEHNFDLAVKNFETARNGLNRGPRTRAQ